MPNVKGPFTRADRAAVFKVSASGVLRWHHLPRSMGTKTGEQSDMHVLLPRQHPKFTQTKWLASLTPPKDHVNIYVFRLFPTNKSSVKPVSSGAFSSQKPRRVWLGPIRLNLREGPFTKSCPPTWTSPNGRISYDLGRWKFFEGVLELQKWRTSQDVLQKPKLFEKQ